MIAILAAALLQDCRVEVRQKSPEVKLVVKAEKESSPGVLLVRRRVLTARDGALGEGWEDVQIGGADVEKDGLRAEITLSQPGLYHLVLGGSETTIAVSRAELAGWKNDLKLLRESAGRLEEMAAAIDQAGTPSGAQIAQWRNRLVQERERISKMDSAFHGSVRALRESVDRLFFYRTLLKLPQPPPGEAAGGYVAPPREKEEGGPTAAREVKPLRDIISREGALLIVEEVRLLVAPKEGSPAETRIVRWRDRAGAFAALRQAYESLGGFPELEPLLKEAQESPEPDDLLDRLRRERESLCKP